MKAMLLAAGFGTRLKPLTDKIPKPLVPVAGIPLIFYNLALLAHHGIREIVINLHYKGDQIEQVLGDGSRFGFDIRYSHEKTILGTGGGIRKAFPLLKTDSLVVLNADIITDVDLVALQNFHTSKKVEATLVLKESPEAQAYGAVCAGDDGFVQSLLQEPAGVSCTHRCIFTGVHLLGREIVDRLPPPDVKSCIVREGYIPHLKTGHQLGAFIHEGYWNDLGSFDRLKETEEKLQSGTLGFSYTAQLDQIKKKLAG